MKKKTLLLALPLVTLMSCGTQQVAIQAYLTQENGLPVINLKDSEHVTYLMLSPFFLFGILILLLLDNLDFYESDIY